MVQQEMKDVKLQTLTEQRDQLLKLRSDSSLVVGFSFHTIVGDIRFDRKETALLLMDYLISDIQKQINYIAKE